MKAVPPIFSRILHPQKQKILLVKGELCKLGLIRVMETNSDCNLVVDHRMFSWSKSVITMSLDNEHA